jgi:DNA-binding response OmpR family regulator
MTTEDSGWLIVEDEALVALLIEDALTDMGLKVAGSVSGVQGAIDFLQQASPTGAILDVNLGGEQVFPVAKLLNDRKAPYMFLTGYGDLGLGEDFSGRPVLQKPFSLDEIQLAVKGLIEGA